MAVPPTDEALGRIGNYRVVAFLGKGGIGAVYRAVDDFSKRQVALKVILPEHRENPELRMRFTQEARIGAQLQHPHIVQVLGGGEIRRGRGATEDTEPAVSIPMLDGRELLDGTLYVVFELLEGPSLREHVAAFGPLPYWEVSACFGPLFEAVGYMHGKGFVHRDLKPGNIHFGDVLKVLDLGSAKADDEALARFEGLERTTGANVPMTWEYRSPETFAEAPENDPQVDLWALAATVYRVVTGSLPFGSASDPASLVRRIVTGRYTPASELDASLPPAVDAFFARAFAPHKADRFASSEEMLHALRGAFSAIDRAPAGVPLPAPIVAPTSPAPGALEPSVSIAPVTIPTEKRAERRRWGVAAGVLLGIAATVAGVFYLSRSHPPRAASATRPTATTSPHAVSPAPTPAEPPAQVVAPDPPRVAPPLAASTLPPRRTRSPRTPVPVRASPVAAPPSDPVTSALPGPSPNAQRAVSHERDINSGF